MINVTQTMIINRTGQILICKRSLSKSFYPGRWNLVGGIVQSTDLSYENSARRIISERTGLRVPYLTFVDLKKENMSTLVKCFSFVCVLRESFPQITLNEDFSEFKFIDIKDIEKYNLICHNKNELLDFYSIIKREGNFS